MKEEEEETKMKMKSEKRDEICIWEVRRAVELGDV